MTELMMEWEMMIRGLVTLAYAFIGMVIVCGIGAFIMALSGSKLQADQCWTPPAVHNPDEPCLSCHPDVRRRCEKYGAPDVCGYSEDWEEQWVN